MNNFNRIKFLFRHFSWCVLGFFNQTCSANCVLSYINDKKLRKNINYKLAIDTMFKWSNNSLLNVYRYGQFIDNERIQQSEKFDKIINVLANYYGYTDVVPKILDLTDNSILSNKEELSDIVLKSFEFKKLDNYEYFIELCENYFKYINSDTFDKANLGTTKNNYDYMMKKYLSIKNENLIKYYYKIFSNSNLLELDEYTKFVDKVFEIESKGFGPDVKNKLNLLSKLLFNCVKDPNIGAFPVLETVDNIEDTFMLDSLNKIFSNPALNKLKNLQLISLYISQLQDQCLLYEFEKLLNNKTLTNSSYFDEIMTNAITIRSFRTLRELNSFITYLGFSQESLEVICKLNYEDELLCDVLLEANYITNLLNDVRISLYVKKLEVLLLELLSKKDYETVLLSLLKLKIEIENNIKQNIVITNTLKIVDLVDKTFKTIDEVDERTKRVDEPLKIIVEFDKKQKKLQKVLDNI